MALEAWCWSSSCEKRGLLHCRDWSRVILHFLYLNVFNVVYFSNQHLVLGKTKMIKSSWLEKKKVTVQIRLWNVFILSWLSLFLVLHVLSSPTLNLFDLKKSVKYILNMIYFCIPVMSKLNVQHHYSSLLQCHMILQKSF